MARAAAPRRPRRGILPVVAGVASVALVATLAVVLDGYDAQEVPPLSTSVWVTRDSGQYARVDTELAEIDTVRSVDDPDGVVQAGDVGLVFTQGLGRVWPIDPARPGDLLGGTAEESGAAPALGEATPAGTREVVQAGVWFAYLTTSGAVFVARLGDDGAVPATVGVYPFRDEVVPEGQEPRPFVATAIAIDDDGMLAMYSAADATVRLYDAGADRFGESSVIAAPPDLDADVSLALVAGRWGLLHAEDGLLWLAGRDEPVDLGVDAAAVLQASTAEGSALHVADRERLLAVDPGSGEIATLVDEGRGVPAQPVVVDGELVAAWVSSSAALLWTSTEGTRELAVDADAAEELDEPHPVLRSNGARAVLNETTSGMLWRVPDGTPIPVEQWSLDDLEQLDQGTVVVDDVAEQEPPVAVSDSFGVRPGAHAVLPLLLNDHDPNQKDVLTIVPESITPIDGFGTLSLAANNQQAVVRVDGGSGSASFSYAVTDGVSVSPPATVTLTLVGDDVNSAPEWCGVEACVQDWPAPGISAGGTVTVPVLSAWVDPEGDVIVLADAAADDPDAPVTVVATAEGDVVVRHQDPNAGDAVIPITVTVADARGATATRTLEVRVTANPALVAEPIAVVTGVGELVTVDLAQHVRGGSGAYAVVDAVQTSSSAGLVVVPNAAAGTIDLTASTAGDYLVTYTVQDLQTLGQQSAIVRVSVVEAGAPLSMAPLTAFVRPNEDTTVDVLSAVQNTTGRVLIVADASTGDPGLGVSVVGQSTVRVSGSTADGSPGRVGTATVTVTDGTGNAVQGTVTVFLVPSESASAPIAVPDTATVRAGSLADIPVLANDVSPRGERLVVHPDLEGSGTAGELAFVTGDRVRYLAPGTPGIYTLRYSVYLENAPQLADVATLTVTVLPAGSNREPQPPILTARVLAGQSVLIPFEGSGIDPDGDRVALADVTQPASGQGIAEITAEGDAIVYTAPGNGVAGGQVSFAYRVRDAEGATADGLVRVGVLVADVGDVAPITYGDYLRVQQGAPDPLTVMPLLNDRDPMQGPLEIQSVVPNAPAGSPEYARLEALLDDSAIDEGVVRVQAGDALGVHSYVYTVVATSSFSTAEGLIVVGVTDAATPDVPQIEDTVVTAENRGRLESGLDVVTGKVQWASGDPALLELAIWGPAASRYTVDGWSISGPLPAEGEVVPFALTGPTPGGGEVTSYGFLRIPAFDDMRIQLRSGVEPIEVDEEQTAGFAVRRLLDLASSDDVEIRDEPEFAVQRANSGCRPVDGDRVEYTAGREAPWTDTCTVPVRIAGQETWTMLGVPVVIRPEAPQAILTSVSRTVPPGESDTIDLYAEMTSWEGGRVGDVDLLQYRVLYSGPSFTVTQNGGVVQIDAHADARPGTRESVQVSVDAYGGLLAGISLVVGIAPPDAPRGATLSQVCTVTDGSCTIAVTGVAGEYDPFQGDVGSGLRLVSVGTGGSSEVACAVATVRVADDRRVVATWPGGAKPVGGECTVPFTVADAQGRTGPGLLTLDVRGFPQPPSTVRTVGYTATSVTLAVPLGDATTAQPAVTGVALYEGGARVDAACTRSGAEYLCVVSGLVNGEDHTYRAVTVNDVGESAFTTPHTTHAYARPEIAALTWESVYRGGVTTTGNGVVALRITADDDVQSFQVRVAGGGTITVPADADGVTDADLSLVPGSRSLDIVPISRFLPPTGGSPEGDAQSRTVLAIGAPIAQSAGSASSTSDGTGLTLTGASASPNSAPTGGLTTIYYVWEPGQSPSCTSTSSGAAQVTGSFVASAVDAATVSGLTVDTAYRMSSCVSYGFGAVSTGEVATFTFLKPAAPAGPLTYSIGPGSSGNATQTYGVSSITAATNPPGGGYQQRYFIGTGQPDSAAAGDLDALPFGGAQAFAAFCKNIAGQYRCSDRTEVTAAGVPTPVRVAFPTAGFFGCVDADDTDVSAPADAYALVDVQGGFIGDTIVVTFSGPYAALTPAEYDVNVCD